MAKRTFEQFRKEAAKKEKTQVEPYELEIDKDTTVVIDGLSAGRLLDLTEADARPKETLRLLCGDQFETVFNALYDDDLEVFSLFFADLVEHFGMGASPSPTGGN